MWQGEVEGGMCFMREEYIFNINKAKKIHSHFVLSLDFSMFCLIITRDTNNNQRWQLRKSLKNAKKKKKSSIMAESTVLKNTHVPEILKTCFKCSCSGYF